MGENMKKKRCSRMHIVNTDEADNTSYYCYQHVIQGQLVRVSDNPQATEDTEEKMALDEYTDANPTKDQKTSVETLLMTDICPICFDVVEKGDAGLTCRHALHIECSVGLRAPVCPMCRAPITEDTRLVGTILDGILHNELEDKKKRVRRNAEAASRLAERQRREIGTPFSGLLELMGINDALAFLGRIEEARSRIQRERR